MIYLHKNGVVIGVNTFNAGTHEKPRLEKFPIVEQIKTLCLECKRFVDIERPDFRITTNGKAQIFGACAECEGAVSLFLKNGIQAQKHELYDKMTSEEFEDGGEL